MDQELRYTKRYYTIGEVCDQLAVAPSLIRHWETVFGKLHTRRDSKGGRLFTPDNLDQLQVIKRLVKDEGRTLEGAKLALAKNNNNPVDIVDELESIKSCLIALRDELNV